jgi:hypothetical protein
MPQPVLFMKAGADNRHLDPALIFLSGGLPTVLGPDRKTLLSPSSLALHGEP